MRGKSHRPFYLWHGRANNPYNSFLALTIDDGAFPPTPLSLNLLSTFSAPTAFLKEELGTQNFAEILPILIFALYLTFHKMKVLKEKSV